MSFRVGAERYRSRWSVGVVGLLALASCYSFGPIDLGDSGATTSDTTSSSGDTVSSAATQVTATGTPTSSGGGDGGGGGGGGGGGEGAGGNGGGCTSDDVESDPRNCGTCGHDCLGGACVQGACQPFLFATAPSINRLALTASYLAYTTDAAICTIALQEGAEPACTVVPSGNLSPAADATHVYWTNTQSGTVSRLVAPAGSPSVLTSGENDPLGVTLFGGDVYWVTHDSVRRWRGDRGAVLIESSTDDLRRIATDGQRLAWKGYGGELTVLETLSPISTQSVTDIGWSGGGGVRIRDGFVYTHGAAFTCGGGLTARTTIVRLDADTLTEMTVLAELEGQIINIDVDDRDVYFTVRVFDQGGETCNDPDVELVGRVPLDGGDITVLDGDAVLPLDIAVDDTSVYWTEQGNGGVLKRLAK